MSTAWTVLVSIWWIVEVSFFVCCVWNFIHASYFWGWGETMIHWGTFMSLSSLPIAWHFSQLWGYDLVFILPCGLLSVFTYFHMR